MVANAIIRSRTPELGASAMVTPPHATWCEVFGLPDMFATILSALLRQLVAFDLAIQRRTLDAKNCGRFRFIPVGVFQRFQNVPLLDVFERFGLVNRHR